MKFSVDKILEALKKLTPKQIAMIIMCVMLTVTVIMATVVIVKVSPVLGALLGTPDETVPSDPTVETTVPPTTEPDTQPTTTPEATNPAHVHKYDKLSKEVAATCTSAGYKIYSCQCGATEMRDSTDALGHSYGPSKLVAPTCTESGYTYRKCNACDYEEKKDQTDPLGHDLKLTAEKKATCEENGNSAYYTCRTCDRVYKDEDGKNETTVEAERLPALGHSYGEWKVTTDPKKGDPGVQTRTCTGCESTETRDCELTREKTKVVKDDCWHYTIEMTAKDSKGKDQVVYSYEVADYGKFKDMDFRYDPESGLIVTFTDKAGKQQTYALTDGDLLSINTDGKPGVPEVTEPSGVPEQSTPSTSGYALGSDVSSVIVTDIDGNSRTIAQILQSKDAVMLNFWYSTCGPCVAEFPYIEAAYRNYSSDVEIVALNCIGESEGTIREFQQEYGLNFTFGIDTGRELTAKFAVTAVPTTVLIDRGGIVCLIQVGSIPDETVFNKAFARFTADDYERVLYRDMSHLLNS